MVANSAMLSRIWAKRIFIADHLNSAESGKPLTGDFYQAGGLQLVVQQLIVICIMHCNTALRKAVWACGVEPENSAFYSIDKRVVIDRSIIAE